MDCIYEYIDEHRDRFIEELLPLVAQPSVSATGEGIEDFARLLVSTMEKEGISTELLATDGFPAVCGEVENPTSEQTLLLFDHYDVVPAGRLEDWATPPFEPTIRDNRIWARGAGDCKGQFFAYFKAIEAWHAVKGDLPITVRFAFNGDDEIGCPSLQFLVDTYSDRLRADAVLQADASTLDVWGPAVILGLRGVLAIELRARGALYEAHSSSYGGLLRNPAIRLAHAISLLRAADGRILIPGFYDDLKPLGQTEKQLLANLHVDKETKLKSLGATEFWGDSGYDYFETQQYRPTFNVHGMVSGYTGEGWTASVPTVATAKIDINILPDLDSDDLLAKIRKHLETNGFQDVEVVVVARSQYINWALPGDPFLEAVSRAQQRVWGKAPVLYPSIGGGGPVAESFMGQVGIPHFLLVPFGQPDMNEHSPRESLDLDWFINGIKVMATVIDEFARSTIGKGAAG